MEFGFEIVDSALIAVAAVIGIILIAYFINKSYNTHLTDKLIKLNKSLADEMHNQANKLKKLSVLVDIIGAKVFDDIPDETALVKAINKAEELKKENENETK